MEHFLPKCTILQAVRYSVLYDIDTEFNIITGKTFYNLDNKSVKLKDIVNHSNLNILLLYSVGNHLNCYTIDK